MNSKPDEPVLEVEIHCHGGRQVVRLLLDLFQQVGSAPEQTQGADLCLWVFDTTAGHQVRILADNRSLPLQIQVDQPDQVGIDRLLNAVSTCKSEIPRRRPATVGEKQASRSV